MLRILVDECINPRLAQRLRVLAPECLVSTVRELQQAGLKDHILVRSIDGRFDIFLTLDKGFEFEHNLRRISFGVVVLTTANNQMPSYERLLGSLLQSIAQVKPGEVDHDADPSF